MNIIWGVNGHYLRYSLPVSQQLNLIHQLGLSSYRVDVYDANASTISSLSALVAQAAPLGISISPVFVPPAGSSYQSALNTATTLAHAIPGLTWEAGNELDLYAGIPGRSGASPSDYDDTRFALAANAIHGMVDGFHADPSSKVIVGTTGLHFGFLQRLASSGVTWDITGEHYYAPPGMSQTDMTAGATSLFSQLAAFGKPISFNEFNQQQGSLPGQQSEATTLTEMMNAVTAAAGQYNVTSAYIYELLDEPNLSGGEAVFGLALSNGTLKIAGISVQQMLAGGAPPPPPEVTLDTLMLQLSEDAFRGDAQFIVKFDGAQLGSGTVTARHGMTPQTFTFQGDATPGAHQVEIDFTNDLTSRFGNRNLWVQDVTYNGKSYGPDPDVKLDRNGPFIVTVGQ